MKTLLKFVPIEWKHLPLVEQITEIEKKQAIEDGLVNFSDPNAQAAYDAETFLKVIIENDNRHYVLYLNNDFIGLAGISTSEEHNISIELLPKFKTEELDAVVLTKLCEIAEIEGFPFITNTCISITEKDERLLEKLGFIKIESHKKDWLHCEAIIFRKVFHSNIN